MRLKSIVLIVASLGLMFLTGCPSGSGNKYIASPEQRLSALTKLGQALLMEGDFIGALSQLSEAELLDPKNPEVLTYIGLAYYGRKDYEKAIDNYSKALSIDPRKTDVHNNLGLVYLEQKRYELARAQFQACLDDPTYAKPYLAQYNLGLLAESQDLNDEAIGYYRQIIDSSAQYAPPYFRLGYLFMQRNDTRMAVDYLLNAVRLDPTYTEAFFMLGEAYEKMDYKDEAAEAYGRVVLLAPNTARAIEAQSRARRVLGFE